MRHVLVLSVLAAGTCVVPCLAQAPAPAAAPVPAEAVAAKGGSTSTRVTVNLEGVTAEEALAELGKIGDIEFKNDNPGSWANADLVILDAKDRSYWPTVLDVCRQAKINFWAQRWGGRETDRQVRVFPGQDLQLDRMPSCEVGGSLLLLQGEQRVYSLGFQNPTQLNSQFSINAVLMLDPKLRLASSSVTADVVTAVDENGMSLAAKTNQFGNYYGGEPGSMFVNVYIPLAYPDKAGRRIAKLEGKLRMTAVTKEENWEIKDILKAKPESRDVNSGTVTIKSLKPRTEGQGYELKFTWRRKGGSNPGRFNNDSQAMWNLVQKINVQTAEGAKFNYGGGGGGDEWTVYLNPPSPQAVPATLSWKIPVEVKELTESFEFKDLPIP